MSQTTNTSDYTSASTATKHKTTFDVKKFIIVSLRSWAVYVGAALCFIVLLGVITMIKPPKDEVFAQIMLKDDTGGGSMMLAGQIARSFSLGDMFGGSSTTDNETFVMQSHTVFLQTVRQMGLNTTYYARPYGILSKQMTKGLPYRLTAPAEMADTLSRTIIFDIKQKGDGHFDIRAKIKRKEIGKVSNVTLPTNIETTYGTFILDKTPDYNPEAITSKYRITYSSYDMAANGYAKLVKIYVPDRKSDFIDLSFVTDNPAFGKELLNRIIHNYISLSNVYKNDRSTESLRLVDERLATLANELLVSEGALEKFKENNNLTDVEADASYLMTKTGMLESQLLEAQTNYEVIKLTRDYINNPENNYSLIPDLSMASGGAPENGGLISQYNQLILERMELVGSAKEGNSTVRQLDQQIGALRANIITSVDRMYQNAQLTLRDLKAEDTRNRSRLGSLPAIERQYIVLKRDNMLQEQIYLFLLQQREELNMNLESRSMPAQVIDYPYVLADPVGLTRLMAIALGMLLGLVAGALYVFFVRMKSHPIKSGKEMDSLLDAPVFTSIGAANDNDEAIRHLRSDVQSALKGCDGKVVAVTSLHDDEGKTYLSVNLAESLAKTGARVAIVDACMRDPQIGTLFGIKGATQTVGQYVWGAETVPHTEQVTVESHCHLDVMPSAAEGVSSADIVANDRFKQLISALSADHDYVVIDSSRIDGLSDIYYITDVADITLVVCRGGKVTEVDLKRLNALYADRRLKRMAVVKNEVK